MIRQSFLAAAVLATLGAASFSNATTIVYQTGFEAPDYNVGNLIGQNNWSQYDANLPYANVTVQNSVVRPGTGGSQSVKFQSMGASADPYSDFTDVWSTDTGVSSSLIAAEPIVQIQWDMMRAPLNPGETATGSWGIDIYDSNANNLVATIAAYDELIGPSVSGSDSLGSQVYLGDGSLRGQWDTYMVQLDYTSRTYSVFFNGAQIGDAQAIAAGADNGIGDVDFLSWTRGTDGAYFDNLSITTNTVPEPSALGAIALVGLSVGRRRRSSRRGS